MDYKEVGIKIFLAGCRGEQALIEYFVCILHVLDFTSFNLLPINCRVLRFLKKCVLYSTQNLNCKKKLLKSILRIKIQNFRGKMNVIILESKPNICICMTNG